MPQVLKLVVHTTNNGKYDTDITWDAAAANEY